jgi:ABC-type dipeptide/oligopeptide/nickel transport system ATPase component
MSQRFTPLEPGKVVRIADMPGRLRSYDLRMSDGSQRTAVGIAVSRRCDLLVAVAQGTGTAAGVSRVTLDFLASDALTKWVTSAMGGR